VSASEEELKDSTLATYAAKAERRLDVLLRVPAAHPDGRELQRQIKAWRGKFFVFLSDQRVPPTNNGSKQEIRPSVVFRKVTNGFRSDWGLAIHAGYRSSPERRPAMASPPRPPSEISSADPSPSPDCP
jgi:transposase